MQTSHLKALQAKHKKLERDIHSEMTHAARNEMLIEKLKKEKLQVKELIARMENRPLMEAPPFRARKRSDA